MSRQGGLRNGLISRILGAPGAVAAHKAARAELDRVSERGREVPAGDYLAAVRAVIEAEADMPWWRR